MMVRAPRPSSPTQHRVPLLQRIRGVVVVGATGALVLTYALPAMAYTTTLTAGEPVAAVAGAQQLTVTGSFDNQVIARDAYTVEKVQERVPGAYAQTAATFDNDSSSPIQWPFLMGVPISTDFGPRVPPCSGCSSFHDGIDMNPGYNTPIQAIAAGVVTDVSYYDDGGLGVYATIEHQIDGQTITSVYAHMIEGSLLLEPGQQVEVGQQVGNVGNTGQSTGPHLHLEIHVEGTAVDPYAWLTERVGAQS